MYKELEKSLVDSAARQEQDSRAFASVNFGRFTLFYFIILKSRDDFNAYSYRLQPVKSQLAGIVLTSLPTCLSLHSQCVHQNLYLSNNDLYLSNNNVNNGVLFRITTAEIIQCCDLFPPCLQIVFFSFW